MINNIHKNTDTDPEDDAQDYEIEELDTGWINKFEEMDKEYNSFYREELSFIRINYIYVNRENEITNISEETCLFKTPGILSKEELIGLIKRNTIYNSIKYSLLSLVKYNIDFEPINLKLFIRSTDKNIGSKFLESLTNIDSIRFNPSISLFHDINNLFIIFIDKSSIGKGGNLIRNHQTTTRKIYIHPTRKQTKRNLFKDSY